MRFSYDGKEYRIVFRHDPDRTLAQHLGQGHDVRALRDDRYGIVLRCLNCDTIVGGHVCLPKALQRRRTFCVIQRHNSDGAVGAPGWYDLVVATGTPNRDAGDGFNKKRGRLAAIENCLNDTECRETGLVELVGGTDETHWQFVKPFREAAWKAFNERRGPYTVHITTGPSYESGSEARRRQQYAIGVQYREGDNLREGDRI